MGGAETGTTYVWGLDLSQRVQGAGGIGGLLLQDTGTKTRLYTYEANGNVGQLVDGTTGAVVAHYAYDPFGTTLTASGTAADANPFRFSTKYTDDDTGLLYYGYRFYSPTLGRWLTRDPIHERGGINLYAFVLNRPNNFIDVLGLEAYYNPFYFHPRIGALVFEKATITDIDHIGSHLDIANSPLIFTCRCGWLDIAHIRHAMDRTLQFYLELQEHSKAGVTLQGTTLTGLQINEILRATIEEDQFSSAAANFAYKESAVYEEYSVTHQTNSAYSPEDLPSNFIGVMIAQRHVAEFNPRPTVTEWGHAMDTDLIKVIKECVPLSKKDALNVWKKYVKNRWGKPSWIFGTGTLLEQNRTHIPMTIACDECKHVKDQTCPSWFTPEWFSPFESPTL